MNKYITYSILLLIGILGIATLIPGTVDKSIYYYFRIQNGNVITLTNGCYSVPDLWVIDSIEKNKNRLIYNLRHKVDDDDHFMSVFSVTNDEVIDLKKNNIIKLRNDLVSIYELGGLSPENTVRYWGYIDKYNIILLGRSVEMLELYSPSFSKMECKN